MLKLINLFQGNDGQFYVTLKNKQYNINFYRIVFIGSSLRLLPHLDSFWFKKQGITLDPLVEKSLIPLLTDSSSSLRKLSKELLEFKSTQVELYSKHSLFQLTITV